jgi:hypothetical protein
MICAFFNPRFDFQRAFLWADMVRHANWWFLLLQDRLPGEHFNNNSNTTPSLTAFNLQRASNYLAAAMIFVSPFLVHELSLSSAPQSVSTSAPIFPGRLDCFHAGRRGDDCNWLSCNWHVLSTSYIYHIRSCTQLTEGPIDPKKELTHEMVKKWVLYVLLRSFCDLHVSTVTDNQHHSAPLISDHPSPDVFWDIG